MQMRAADMRYQVATTFFENGVRVSAKVALRHRQQSWVKKVTRTTLC
jgi:hypothetical protein